jgi:lysophospholipase L1-like esterase
MKRFPARTSGPIRAAVAVALVAGGVLLPVGTASAGQRGLAVTGYLALGDSVAFGYVPANAVQPKPPDYNDPSSFVGYPEDLARALRTTVANASCPGETTMSFLAEGAQSNGCENSVSPPYSRVGYRTVYPLHVKYSGTQMEYAIKYLESHPSTNLVTIDIGANDAFICQETTSDGCVAEFVSLLAQIKDNLASTYQQLRDVAGYHGTIVAVTYYSTNYADALLDAETQALDRAIANVTQSYGGVVASGYAAFKGPSEKHGGSPCLAGLLVKVSSDPDAPPDCNIHPSPAGHLLLAAAIAEAIGA